MTQKPSKFNKKEKMFNGAFFLILTAFALIIFIVCFYIPKWITSPSNGRIIFDDSTGKIGDSMGGILGPPIALIVAGLTFLAFWMQYHANKILKKDIEKRDETILEETFENRYYELLKLHRTNIEDLRLGKDYKNRQVFHWLFVEYKFTFESILNLIYTNQDNMNSSYCGFEPTDYDKIALIAYVLYYWGVGPISSKMIIPQLKDLCSIAFAEDCISHLNMHKGFYKKKVSISENANSKTKAVDFNLVFSYDGKKKEERYKFRYMPFDGHAQRLGHYYRHLFLIVKFVAEYNIEIINDGKKYDYLKILRAQLSSYEQLLLYYNSLSSMGKAWNDQPNNFIAKFRLIKNIPIPLTSFAHDPRIKYKDEIEKLKKINIHFFEWDET
jgi:hypothetical protein